MSILRLNNLSEIPQTKRSVELFPITYFIGLDIGPIPMTHENV